MKNYLKARISNYNICIDKIQNAIDECVKNDLWDEVSSLEAIRNKIINLVFALKTSYSNPFDAKFLINLILNYSFIFDWIIQK